MARTQVQSELIAANALTATLIPDDTITSTQLAANSVDTAEIVTGSIDTIHIAANNVTAAKIVTNAIQTRHIADDQVTGDKLTNNITVAGTLTSTGALTANAGVVVDNITIDGTEIDLSSGNLTLDVAGSIILNADGGQIQFHDGATEIGVFESTGNDFIMEAKVQDEDILLKGNDGGSGITALTLDMSEAGKAIFNDAVTIGTSTQLNNARLTVDNTGGEVGISLSEDGTSNTAIWGLTALNAIGTRTNHNFIIRSNDTNRLTIAAGGTVTVAKNAVGTLTTDNDGSFDMAASNNFKCTPSGNFTLTFTNIVSQSGNILLVNSGGHTVSAHANTKVDANLLATVTAAGTYLISYFSDGTNVYLTNSAIYT